MIEWRALINGCEFVSGYAFKGSDFNDESNGIPIIKIKNIQNDFVTLDTSQHISEKLLEKYKSNHKYKVYNDELLISMTGAGSVGRVGLTNINQIALLNQRVGKFVTDEINLNKEYLYHILTSDYFQRLLFNKGQGSGQPNLSPDEILEVEIPWPSYKDQVTIGKALHNLTSKIILLQAQNQTLEQTAQTIFKEWFGKYQVGDELPEGWRVGKLGDVSSITAGGDKPKNSTKEETENNRIPIYSNGITNDGLYGFTDVPKISEESVTVSARGTIGFVCLRLKPYVPIVRLISVVPNRNHLSNKYLFFWLNNQNISGSGTTQQQLTVPVFKRTEIIVPSNDLIKEFTVIVDSFYEKINLNIQQIQTLTQTRDTLLPKLMRGDIRVNGFKK